MLLLQDVVPTPPPPPPGITIARGGGVTINGVGGPTAIYRAAQNKREVLGDQLNRMQNRRDDVARELRERATEGADKAGLEKQLTEMDARISDLEKQVGQADQEVAQAAGVPGVVLRDPPPPRTGPPEEFFVLGGIFIVVVLMPMAVGYARRLWKRAAIVSAMPQSLLERFHRLEQSVDTIAIEIERQGEGQRFLTKLFAEHGPRALGQGAAQPVQVGARDAVEQKREG